jgi:hypothetical protein
MSDTSKPESGKARRPIHSISAGGIEVSIWENQGQKGTFYTVTHRRSYKQGDEWKETDSYGEDDLLRLSKLIDEADSWIAAHRRGQRAGKKSAA